MRPLEAPRRREESNEEPMPVSPPFKPLPEINPDLQVDPYDPRFYPEYWKPRTYTEGTRASAIQVLAA